MQGLLSLVHVQDVTLELLHIQHGTVVVVIAGCNTFKETCCVLGGKLAVVYP